MFEWDQHNVDHIAEHDVSPDEAEQAMTDPRRVRIDVYGAPTERRYGVLGATEVGRLLRVVFTVRRGRYRVVTASTPTAQQQRRYRRRRQ